MSADYSRNESIVTRIAGLGAAITGVWTVVGAVSYALLWSAYANFYDAFGLTPEDVGLSRERIFVPAALAGLIAVTFLAVGALAAIGGYRLTPTDLVVRRPMLTVSLLISPLVIISISAAILVHVLTGLSQIVAVSIAASFDLGCMFSASRWPGVLSCDEAVTVFDRFADAATGSLPGIGYVLVTAYVADGLRPEEPAWLGWQALIWSVAAIPAIVLLGAMWSRLGQRWWRILLPPMSCSFTDGRRRARKARLIGLSVISLALVVYMVVDRALVWSGSQRQAGERTADLGWRDQDLRWMDPSVRPIRVKLLDVKKDPIGVCATDPQYAASLLGQSGDGWWLLLREFEAGKVTFVRVIWLNRDTYSIDLNPMVWQPPSDSSGTQQNPDSGSSPYRWLAPACG